MKKPLNQAIRWLSVYPEPVHNRENKGKYNQEM